jgi:hypothetical protein
MSTRRFTAPGVYAERAKVHANLYTSIVGLCADVNAYQQARAGR